MTTVDLNCPTCGKPAYEATTSEDTARKFSCTVDPAHDWTLEQQIDEPVETDRYDLGTFLGVSAFVCMLQAGQFEDTEKVFLDVGTLSYTIAIEDITERKNSDDLARAPQRSGV